LCGEWEHAKTVDVIQVADFFGDGSIAIEKNGGTQRRSFSQKPPPLNEANCALLLPRLPA
jgi:hypothetical protein